VCVSERLFYTASMADRAEKLVERHHADVVVLFLQKNQFTAGKVVFKVRKRWPGMYERALALSQRLKGLAGGGAYGAAGLRGWIFRAPVFFAQVIVGTDTEVSVEEAILRSRETLERLAKDEEATIVCKMPRVNSGWVQSPKQLADVMRFREALAEMCGSRLIPLYSEVDRPIVKRRWLRRTAPDRVHQNIDSREDDATVLVMQVLEASKVGVLTA